MSSPYMVSEGSPSPAPRIAEDLIVGAIFLDDVDHRGGFLFLPPGKATRSALPRSALVSENLLGIGRKRFAGNLG